MPPAYGESSSPTAPEVSNGILGAMPIAPPRMPLCLPQVHNPPQIDLTALHGGEDQTNRRQWMPKMDFPRFDDTDVRIWLDKCEAFFRLYHIPDNFRVTSASLYLTDNAVHWYQAFKQQSAFHTWEQFCVAVLRNSMLTFTGKG